MLYLKTLIIVVQLLSALGVIGLVLLQHGKGADMGAAFGSGASGSLFGATGSANFLSRTTAVLAAIFFITTLALTYLGSYKPQTSAGVLGGAAPVPASAPAAAASAPVSAPVASSAPGADVPK
ncbi:preprotein translocase subunit SecG [Burkholderia sp. SFA1]|uniref:preprotein translocase subunit SecG n=1 Tax=unclassified Caballeronia TaxID=2646786 RepID=UPI000238888D|nr:MULTISPECIES: preprotein translocase subunit SecG [unclassified Caballeronia]AET89540.1 preprotein translocase, SecG subunit [Burkholderia sp. YI23]MCE4541410.1 preprotein translocase subunit SecG [Caballeronia sp. PC1]MCE4569546.1 preprotein translocase subunit SecG [Caballeronia sp. CLC5]BBP96699.1 preprotein translocase subunit SecG [Burkholderia sp. SFA1]